MSRSFKKQQWKKDKKPKEYNRRFRRINKTLVKIRLEPKLQRETDNQYTICDWKMQSKVKLRK